MISAALASRRSSAVTTLALLVLVLAAGAVAAAEPAELVGRWSNPEGSFRFAADGTVEVVNQGQAFRGQWAAETGVLWVQLPAGRMTFRLVAAGDDPVLEAPEVCRACAAATAGVGEALGGVGQTIIDTTGS